LKILSFSGFGLSQMIILTAGIGRNIRVQAKELEVEKY
jgi:hypothetical protein